MARKLILVVKEVNVSAISLVEAKSLRKRKKPKKKKKPTRGRMRRRIKYFLRPKVLIKGISY